MQDPEALRDHWKTGGGLAVALLSRDDTFTQALEYNDKMAALQETFV